MVKNRRYRVNAPQVISENIEGELVMINLLRGSYHSAEGSGALIWSLIEQGLSPEKVVTALCASGDDEPAQIRPPVTAFIDELIEAELIVPSEYEMEAVAASEAELTDNQPFAEPALNTYSDMADILMLDPVHDVDEKGWPQPKAVSEPE